MTDTTETIPMTLGGRTFAVPSRLPWRITKVLFPFVRDMSAKGGLADRVVADGLMNGMSDEDLAGLTKIATLLAQAAEPEFTADELNALPVTPVELFDAFWDVARFATGMWVKADPKPASDGGEPEAPEETTQEEPLAA